MHRSKISNVLRDVQIRLKQYLVTILGAITIQISVWLNARLSTIVE